MSEDRQGGKDIETANTGYLFNEVCCKGEGREVGCFLEQDVKSKERICIYFFFAEYFVCKYEFSYHRLVK